MILCKIKAQKIPQSFPLTAKSLFEGLHKHDPMQHFNATLLSDDFLVLKNEFVMLILNLL